MSTMFAKPFDARTVEPQAAFDPLPAGWYTAMIVEAEEKDASSGGGNRYLELKMEIMGGDYAKRMIWDRLNLVHVNSQTQDIAYRTFSAICHATGVLVVTNPQELYAKPMLVKVKLRAARKDEATGKEYDASNEVNGYKAIDPNAAPVTGPAKPSAAPAAAGGPTPAWATAAPGASPAAPQTPPPAWAGGATAPAAAPVAPPVAAPAAPVAPPAPVPPPPQVFPPEGWAAHPQAPGYFYKGQEVLTEAALRATMTPPAPVVPPAPVAPPVPPAAAQAQTPAPGGAPPWAQNGQAPAAGGTPPWAKP